MIEILIKVSHHSVAVAFKSFGTSPEVVIGTISFKRHYSCPSGCKKYFLWQRVMTLYSTSLMIRSDQTRGEKNPPPPEMRKWQRGDIKVRWYM